MIKKGVNIRGLGVDMVEIVRFRVLKPGSKGNFLKKVFSEEELEYCFSFKDPSSHLGGLFAAKEAVVKALVGNVFIPDIEVRHNKAGAPKIWRKKKMQRNILISISHTEKIACAVAILI